MKQTLNYKKNFDIEIVDIDSKDDIKSIEDDMIHHVFDVYHGDTFCTKIFRLSDGTGGFIFNIHHLFADSWSLGIVANDIVHIYSCLVNGEEVVKNNDFSYLNYINSEKEYFKSDKFKKDKEYWSSIFSTVPEQATIPSFKSDSTNNFLTKANRKLFNIDKDIIGKISDFCKSCNVSVFNFFMAVFSIYIGRVNNLDDFVIGTPILNRTNYAEKNTTGMFINTAPLRVLVDNDLSFKSFVSNVAKDSLGMLRHQKYYYQTILEDLRKDEPSLPNLYNILISYQVTKAATEKGVNYSTRWIFNGNIADDIDIHLYDLNSSGSIDVAYDYKVSKYSDSDVEDIHNRILYMICQILEKNDICLNDIDIVTNKEKYNILYKFNDTKADYPKDKNIIDLFEEQVKRVPNKTAVVCDGKILTYNDLYEKVNILANYITTYNLEKETPIAIFLDKSLEMIIAMLAILKAGFCYLPVDVSYPKTRINYMLNDASAKLILSNKSVSNLLDTNIEIINIDLTENFYNTQVNLFKSKFNISSSNLAYIMYTSGSTGNPKGVMIEQKSIIRLVKNTNFISFDDNDRILQTGSIVFDACTFEIWIALLNGLELYIIKKDDLLNIFSFSRFLKDNKISILWLTAPLFNQICEQNPTIFEGVKCLLTGGDVLSPRHINMAKLSNPNLTIINGYGPTENTTFSCCFTIDNEYSHSIPIGKPIANSSCYIVSKCGNLQPVGVPGELWVGGDGVARGYLNNEVMTNKSFCNNFLDNLRVYKTGDLVKWLPDGNIEFIGRIDNQVKVRGFRVELNEINSKILQFHNVKDSITLICNNNNDKFICSYVVFKSDNSITELKNFLKGVLPNYMIPSFITPLKVLPINTNGKVDKKMLPSINFLEKDLSFIEPISKTEIELSKIWKSLFNINEIGSNYDFFEIGGDSLLAIKLSTCIMSVFNVEVNVSDIFKYPVLGNMAKYIDSCKNKNKSMTIQKAPKMNYYPLSSAQKRIYYASCLDSDSTLYNIAGGIVINNLLDVEKLKNCFNILINRHGALRTHFEIKDNDVVQIIDDKINFNLELDTAVTDNLNDIYSNFVKPFDLSIAPLFRVKLVKLKDNKMLLLLDMHHIISDGTSLAILLQELCDLYNGSTLNKKLIDYTDFTLWEKEQFKTEDFNNKKDYWVNQFSNEIPLLNMPTSYPRPSTQSFEGANYYITLSKTVFDKINSVSKELNITPYMFMLSCYYILLSKYSSNEDIVVGTPIIGRISQELDNVLGMFVNTLALRNKIDSNLTFNSFSENIRKNCINSFKNQDYPFDMLVKDLNIKRDSSRNSLFDVMFVYQNNGYPKINFNNTKTQYFIPNNNVAKFDLTLEVIPVDNEYSLRFEYCTKLFDEDFIKKLSSHYINILDAILEDCNVKIDDIDMLSRDEKNLILYDLNNTKMDYPKDKTIAQLFEEQVKKTPNSIAVVFEDRKLTYNQLNERANQLAKFMLDSGIKQNSIVGIMLPRCVEILISMLATLKLNACYIPIDPTLPKDRINYMLNNSNATTLLTFEDISSNVIINNYINVKLDNSQIYNCSAENLNLTVNLSLPAYIIYTSRFYWYSKRCYAK